MKRKSQTKNRIANERNNQILIKKYKNRKLYDTEAAQYITLHDIRYEYMDKIPFQIINHSHDDITHQVVFMSLAKYGV